MNDEEEDEEDSVAARVDDGVDGEEAEVADDDDGDDDDKTVRPNAIEKTIEAPKITTFCPMMEVLITVKRSLKSMKRPTAPPQTIPARFSEKPKSDEGKSVVGNRSIKNTMAANSHMRSPHAAKK